MTEAFSFKTKRWKASSSMGGNIAATMSQLRPNRVSQLILVDAAINDSAGLSISSLIDAPVIRDYARHLLRSLVSRDAITYVLESALYDDTIITPELVDAYTNPVTLPDWDLALIGIVRDSGENALPQPYEEIKAPVSVIWGEHDSWIPIQRGRELCDRVTCTPEMTVIRDAGHVPMLEEPSRFNQAILESLYAN